MATLLSERLIGEPASEESHRDVAVELFGDPLVAEWIWPGERGGARTPAQAEKILARFARGWAENGIGWWYLRRRDDDVYVGEVGLQHATVDDAPAVEIGWTLLSAHWGRGYATEAARAALAHGFDTLGFDEIVAFTLPHNRASRRVMERLGMSYEGATTHAGLPHVLYRIAAPTFARIAAPGPAGASP